MSIRDVLNLFLDIHAGLFVTAVALAYVGVKALVWALREIKQQQAEDREYYIRTGRRR